MKRIYEFWMVLPFHCLKMMDTNLMPTFVKISVEFMVSWCQWLRTCIGTWPRLVSQDGVRLCLRFLLTRAKAWLVRWPKWSEYEVVLVVVMGSQISQDPSFLWNILFGAQLFKSSQWLTGDRHQSQWCRLQLHHFGTCCGCVATTITTTGGCVTQFFNPSWSPGHPSTWAKWIDGFDEAVCFSSCFDRPKKRLEKWG